MPKLESTPYRVFYLIDRHEDRNIFGFNWNRRYGVEDNDTEVYISATFIRRNDFNSVNVYYSIRSSEESKSGSCPWNDINQEVIDYIERYYDLNRGLKKRILDYADSIQRLYENSELLKFEVDLDGSPRVAVKGLPYVSADSTIKEAKVILSSCEIDYVLTVDDGVKSSGRHPITMTMEKLRETVDKANKYDCLSKSIEALIKYPELLDEGLRRL